MSAATWRMSVGHLVLKPDSSSVLPDDVGPPTCKAGRRADTAGDGAHINPRPRRSFRYRIFYDAHGLLLKSPKTLASFRCNSGMELYGHLLSDTLASTSNPPEGEAHLPPLPPELGGESWVGDDRGVSNPECTDAGSALPLRLPGGGPWEWNDEMMPGGGPRECNNEMMPTGTGEEYDQLMHGGSFLNPAGGMQNSLDHRDFTDLLIAAESLGMNQADVDSPGMNQPAVHSSGMSQVQVGAYPPAMGYSLPMPPAAGLNQSGAYSSTLTQVSFDTPVLTPTSAYPPAMDYLQPWAQAADVPQAVPENEMMELAEMIGVAAECGNNVSTTWSEEEEQHLLDGLARLANENIATKCFKIADGLKRKLAVDVALRIRWLEEKKVAKQTGSGTKKSREMVTKGKGTKDVNKKNNKYLISKEALNFKSTKDLIRDNYRLMDQIEENLKTGQLRNTPEYFYYVKTNMDAIQKKLVKTSDMGNSMERLSIDQEAYEEVMRDHNYSSGKDTTTP